MTDPTTLCIPKPRGSQRRRKVQKSRGGGGTNLRLYISAYVLFYLKNLEGAPKFGGDSKTPGALCFEWSFTWTYPGNQDVIVK